MNAEGLYAGMFCRRFRFQAVFVAAMIAGWLLPSRVEAFERQWHAGAGLSYTALIRHSGDVRHGVGGGLHLTYGINDTWNLLAEFNVVGQPAQSAMFWGGGIGAAYVID